MDKITIIIHSHQSKQLDDCLESAQLLTSNILIIGNENRNDIKITPFINSGIVETAREFGINKATTNWVFLLDVDERMTKELAEEVKSIIIGSNQLKSVKCTYYKVPRKEIVFGKKWLKYGGWWPNYQTRLIYKPSFVNWPKHIHSTPIINGKVGFLKNPILHYSQNDIEEIVRRTINFENKESDLLFQANKQANTPIFLRKFLGELWRRLIKRFGFLDGPIGIIESIYQAFSKTITYIYLYEKRNKKTLPAGR